MRETEHRNNMKIAIDARMIQMSGIGTYIKTLMGHGIYAVALGDDKDILKYDESVQVINYDEKYTAQVNSFIFLLRS